MRILIVENDQVIAGLLRAVLERSNIYAFCTYSGEEGLDFARMYNYDLVLTEFLLKDMSGSEFVTRLRFSKVDTPIIVYSGIHKLDWKIRCLDLGAADCVDRPVRVQELTSRILAVVRRSYGLASSIIKVGKLTVNLNTRSADIDGRSLDLTTHEYCVLETMSLRQGCQVTRDVLMDQLYGSVDGPYERIVDTYITKVRKKIAVPGYIHTIRRGDGWRLSYETE